MGKKIFLMVMASFLLVIFSYDKNYFNQTLQHASDQSSIAETVKSDQVIKKNRTVFVHLFEWKWTDIARECENFLGPKGFAAVQVSPVNEHRVIIGNPWYERYQTVSYKIASRSGNRAEFVDMVKRCKAVGVDIYVDAVLNHTTGVLEPGQTEIGFAGSWFGRYEYPGIYSFKDFHHCHRHGNDDIQNYQDRWEVQNCQLVHLADLDTSSEYVRSRLADYLNDLLTLGVAGFRIDAAKHIASNDLQAIFRLLHHPAFIYQEVIDHGNEPIKASEYFPNGSVTEFKYSVQLSDIFRYSQLASLKKFGLTNGFIPSQKAIVFVDNHDNQRADRVSHHVLTYKDGQLYTLANIFMLAWPYGYPQIMSSYDFKERDQGPPADFFGNTLDIYVYPERSRRDKNNSRNCFSRWICEHRQTAIANMVEFRNYTATDFYISNWWSNGNNQIAFSRGNQGFVALNKENFALKHRLQTGLSPGLYCNIITGELTKDGQNCTGNMITVSANGFSNLEVPPGQAIAIYGNQKIIHK